MLEKEFIIFFHALAAVAGMGTAIFLQMHGALNLVQEVRVRDQKIYAMGHRLIMVSVSVLILSGLGFLIYYALNSPETLSNQKIYGKSLMVLVLLINGIILNSSLQATLKKQVGKGLFENMSLREIRGHFYNGTLSFTFWILIFILGTFRSLNNVFSIEVYIATIVGIIIGAGGVAHLLALYELRRQKIPEG